MLTEEEFSKLTTEKKSEYLKRLKAIRGREDLIYLCKDILGYGEIEGGVHGKLVEVLTDDKRRKLILLPRGSFKSTIGTIGFSIYSFLRDPNIRILLDSEVLENSQKFLAQIKLHLRQESFVELYGDLISNKYRETAREFTVTTRTSKNLKEGTVYATGIGTVNVGQHYDLIIADDLHSEKNVTTKDQIEGVIAHYRLLLSLLEPNGTMILIGTRWHWGDTYEFLLENEVKDSKEWEVYIEKAIRKDGSLFFPNRLTEQFLREQRLSQGSYLFSCQYLNEPIDDETQIFKKTDFQYWGGEFDSYPSSDGNRVLLNCYILIDRAFSSSKDADFTGCVCLGISSSGNVYVLEAERLKGSLNELWALVYRWVRKYGDRVRYVGVETINWEEIEFFMREQMNKNKRYFNLTRLMPYSRQRKEDRIIEALQPLYTNKKVFHKRGQVDLEDELLRFPKNKHDDLIDAFAYIKQVITVPSDPKFEREVDYVPSGMFGRTGY